MNRRAKAAGGAYAAAGGFAGRWDDLNRFGRARATSNALRRERSALPAGPPLERADVTEVIRRVYGLSAADVAAVGPAAARDAVVAKWCGRAPDLAGREFTLVAPGLSGTGTEDEARLEARGAFFHLIDAELRHTRDAGGGVTRALLRWAPVRRTAQAVDFRRAVELAAAVHLKYSDVPPPQFDLLDAGKRRWWHWHGQDRFRLELASDSDGRSVLATGSIWVTEGLADLRQPRRAGLGHLLDELKHLGAKPFGKGGEICVPFGGDLTPAAALAAGYYKLLARLGCFEPFRWYRREAGTVDTSAGS